MSDVELTAEEIEAGAKVAYVASNIGRDLLYVESWEGAHDRVRESARHVAAAVIRHDRQCRPGSAVLDELRKVRAERDAAKHIASDALGIGLDECKSLRLMRDTLMETREHRWEEAGSRAAIAEQRAEIAERELTTLRTSSDAVIHGLLADVERVKGERDEARARCRESARTLIEAVGANGPENVDATAVRAAGLIDRHRSQLTVLRKERDALAARVDAIREARKLIISGLARGAANIYWVVVDLGTLAKGVDALTAALLGPVKESALRSPPASGDAEHCDCGSLLGEGCDNEAAHKAMVASARRALAEPKRGVWRRGESGAWSCHCPGVLQRTFVASDHCPDCGTLRPSEVKREESVEEVARAWSAESVRLRGEKLGLTVEQAAEWLRRWIDGEGEMDDAFVRTLSPDTFPRVRTLIDRERAKRKVGGDE